MSELTTCNYCHMKWIRHSASKKKLRVVKKQERGWTAIYLKKPGFKTKETFVASFMELPDKCVC